MQTSLKTGFAQIFSRCPLQPPSPPWPVRQCFLLFQYDLVVSLCSQQKQVIWYSRNSIK